MVFPDNIESGGKCGLRNIKICKSPSELHEFLLCFRIFVRPGLNFNVINLNILQMVDLIVGYNLCKFQINSLYIEVRTSFLVWQKFFRTFIKICNIEIRNRLLWVRWYHGNSTFPPYWNAKMPSFAQYELIKPRERLTILWISTFPWYLSYH